MTFDNVRLPEGVSLIATDSQRIMEPLRSGQRRHMLFPLKVSQPAEGTISLNLVAREEGNTSARSGGDPDLRLAVLESAEGGLCAGTEAGEI